ncbi:phosphotransferases [Striga asiatica]|uniref:Phosphotransferases n=1 Tax=Striga asiatica TaxID=4170 RepID=A0A5A7PCH3_STRAF|nr:phosphotransferases [Striga asiatica]
MLLDFSNSPQEELRSSIISMVQQSAALNRPGVETLKPRQLSDAIHQEIGDKVMSQISDGVWNVIRSADGMKNEITETVQSVYDKLSNPSLKDNGESSSHRDSHSARNERENHGEVAEAIGKNGVLSDGEPNEPPGFGSTDVNQRNMNSQKNQPDNNSLSASEKHNGDSLHVENLSEAENMDCDAPPGFPSIIKHETSGDAGDEDPDVPPGFG